MNDTIEIARVAKGMVLTQRLLDQLQWTYLMLGRCLTVRETRQVMKQLAPRKKPK
jgi:hypothetical protein